jgi:outer membrane lipoprotein SlyB
MESTTSRLDPLISVTVLCAIGVAALTGMIPASKGQENALQLPKEMVKPLEPAITHPVAKPAAPKRAARPAPPRNAQASQAQPSQVQEAPKPQAPLGQLAIVESVREVKEPGDGKGVGAIAGGLVGGVLGNKLSKGKGLVTILGAAGGAFAGHQVEKRVRSEKRWEIAVRLDDGSQRTLSSDIQPAWHAGDRVRLIDDKLQPV